MTRETSELTAEQMDQICAVLAVGCDRETAAGVVDCALTDIGCEIADNTQFARRVRRAEATAEWRHMQNILNATKDGKYWRASVWWLERRSPERFARRPAGAITQKQLEQAVAAWNEMLQQKFDSPNDQERITACFDEIHSSIELLIDAQSAKAILNRHDSLPQIGHVVAENDEAVCEEPDAPHEQA